METVQVDYESTFEALPGLYILLNNDSPVYTIAAVTQEYAENCGIPIGELRGKSILEIGNHIFSNGADRSLRESLAKVSNTGRPHASQFVIDENGQGIRYEFVHRPVRSKAGDMSFIIHSVELSTSQIKTHRNSGEEHQSLSLENIIAKAPVALAILSQDNLTIQKANDRMLRLWGKDGSAVGRPLLEAVPEINDHPCLKNIMEVLASGKECCSTEPRFVRDHRDEIQTAYFNFVYSPLEDSDQEVTAIMIIGSDVTEQVSERKKLQESEKRYEDLIVGATVATAVYTGEAMTINFANAAMLRLWGKDHSVIGKPIREAVPELVGQPFLDLLRNVFKTGETYHTNEARATLNVDGKPHTYYLNFTYKALRDSHGLIYGVLDMSTDITDVVKAATQIFEAEERWRLALDSAELGTWDYYPETKDFICSDRTKELFGVPRELKAKFETMLQAIHADDRERVAQEIRKSLRIEGGAHYRAEYSVVGISDSRHRWHRITGQAFYDADGNAYRLTGTVLDITERKKIEEALEERVHARTIELQEANKELERSNHELEQYAYIASHDLQEPLRKILVYSDLLKQKVLAGPNRDEKLDKIIASARRMSNLIKDLLNFSKALKNEDCFKPINIGTIIINILEDFELVIQETNAIVSVDHLPELEASPQQMNQLFYNLLSNALKFRKHDQVPVIHIGSRQLSPKEISTFCDLDQTVLYYDIFVSDNGIGFQQKYEKQIFEIFKRLNNNNRFEGTGIGLAVCRKIAAQHHGTVYAESREGDGAVFHVILPLTQKISKDDATLSSS